MFAARVAGQVGMARLVDNLETAVQSPNLVMDNTFRIVNKKSWAWSLLCLIHSFYKFFGSDGYSHVRINNVANAILKACQENRIVLRANKDLLGRLQAGLTALDTKSKGKYNACLQNVRSSLDVLTAPDVVRPPTALTSHIRSTVPPATTGPANPPPTVSPTKLPSSAAAASTISPQRRSEVPAATDPGPGVHLVATGAPAPAMRYESAGFRLLWPADEELLALKVNLRKAQKLKTALEELVPLCLSPHENILRFEKTEKGGKLQVVDRDDERILQEKVVPLSVEIIYQDGLLQDVIFLTDFCLAKGGETGVYACFGLFQGIPMVRKDCGGLLPFQLLGHFAENPYRGIVRVRRVDSEPSPHSIEDFMFANLGEYIKKPRPDFVHRFNIALDILYGILAIHCVECDEYTLQDGSKVGRSFKLSHKDITPSNVLIKPTAEDPNVPAEGALTDFGCTHPEHVGGTPGYKAPEMIQLCLDVERLSDREIIDYNIKYGQAGDVWSAGLVIAALILWEVDPWGAPPVHCIAATVSMGIEQGQRQMKKAQASSAATPNPVTFDKNIRNVTQANIDSDLQALKFKCLPQVKGNVKLMRAMEEIWTLIGAMVQKEPGNRITIQDAIARLEAIGAAAQ